MSAARPILAFVFAVALSAGHSHGASPEVKVRDLSPLLPQILERHNVPGMAVAIVSGKDVVALGAAGIRRTGKSDRITIEDKFHLGSCTKSMTATLCAELVESGRLSWTMTLANVFPENAAKMRPEYRTVTLEQLLTNVAGMPADL